LQFSLQAASPETSGYSLVVAKEDMQDVGLCIVLPSFLYTNIVMNFVCDYLYPVYDSDAW